MKDPEGDKWTVSARINYTVSWTCTGNCGGQTGGDLAEEESWLDHEVLRW